MSKRKPSAIESISPAAKQPKLATFLQQSAAISATTTASSVSAATPSIMQVNKPTKVLTIKPFKVKPKPPEQFEAELFQLLHTAVQAIFQKQAVQTSLEELYRAVESLCMHKKAQETYDRLQQQMQHNIAQVVQTLAVSLSDPDKLLRNLNSVWTDFQHQIRTLRSIYLYLDRTFVISSTSSRSLWELALSQFRNCVLSHSSYSSPPPYFNSSFSSSNIKQNLLHTICEALIDNIRKEREGLSIDRILMKNITRFLLSLNLYSSSFEPHYLFPSSHHYFITESDKQRDELSTADYLEFVEKCTHSETDRVSTYLDSSSLRSLISDLDRVLIERNASTLIDQGFNNLMKAHRAMDLTRLYSLFSRVASSTLPLIQQSLSEYIKTTGLSIVMDESKDKDMIESLLTFKAQINQVESSCFQSNPSFHTAITDSFAFFINQRKNKPAELMAKYLDEKLKSSRGVSEAEMEKTCDSIIELFRFVHGKDVFEAYYKTYLSKRLLLNKSSSQELEKSLLRKLNKECGHAFTSKLEAMFKDMEISKEVQQSFENYLNKKRESTTHNSSIPDIELEAHVLTQGVWPVLGEAYEVSVPSEILSLQEDFKNFYLQQYTGRKLVWQHSLAQCILRGQFAKGRHELLLSGFQALVCLCYNEHDTLTYSQIQTYTRLQEKELTPTLYSLSSGKIQILRKEPANKGITPQDKFHFNAAFRHELFRIKINQVQWKETKEEKDSTDEHIQQDRQYQMDAAIVRIMKSRKSLAHSELITETLSQLRFPANIPDLKKRIESLLEREYLERDANQPNIYHYLA